MRCILYCSFRKNFNPLWVVQCGQKEVKLAGNQLLFPYVHCGNLLIRSNPFFVGCRQKFHKLKKKSTQVVWYLHSLDILRGHKNLLDQKFSFFSLLTKGLLIYHFLKSQTHCTKSFTSFFPFQNSMKHISFHAEIRPISNFREYLT